MYKVTILRVHKHGFSNVVYYYTVDWIDNKGAYNHAYISGHRLIKCN